MPRTITQIVTEQVAKVGKDLRVAGGMQAVAAVVDADSLDLEAAGVASYGVALLEHRYSSQALSGELVGRTHAGRSRAENNYVWQVFRQVSLLDQLQKTLNNVAHLIIRNSAGALPQTRHGDCSIRPSLCRLSICRPRGVPQSPFRKLLLFFRVELCDLTGKPKSLFSLHKLLHRGLDDSTTTRVLTPLDPAIDFSKGHIVEGHGDPSDHVISGMTNYTTAKAHCLEKNSAVTNRGDQLAASGNYFLARKS